MIAVDYTLAEKDIACPFCGELTTILLDLSGGDQSYIEDCQVCCRPMQINLKTGHKSGAGDNIELQVDCAS